jgi:hypothetical protein
MAKLVISSASPGINSRKLGAAFVISSDGLRFKNSTRVCFDRIADPHGSLSLFKLVPPRC